MITIVMLHVVAVKICRVHWRKGFSNSWGVRLINVSGTVTLYLDKMDYDVCTHQLHTRMGCWNRLQVLLEHLILQLWYLMSTVELALTCALYELDEYSMHVKIAGYKNLMKTEEVNITIVETLAHTTECIPPQTFDPLVMDTTSQDDCLANCYHSMSYIYIFSSFIWANTWRPATILNCRYSC